MGIGFEEHENDIQGTGGDSISDCSQAAERERW